MSGQARCPQCGEAAALSPDNTWRPFCSRRCKLIDLGEWFAERHTIPGPPVDDDAIDATTPDASRH